MLEKRDARPFSGKNLLRLTARRNCLAPISALGGKLPAHYLEIKSRLCISSSSSPDFRNFQSPCCSKAARQREGAKTNPSSLSELPGHPCWVGWERDSSLVGPCISARFIALVVNYLQPKGQGCQEAQENPIEYGTLIFGSQRTHVVPFQTHAKNGLSKKWKL